MAVMELGSKGLTMDGLLRSSCPTGPEIIRVFECDRPNVQIMKANAGIFEAVLPKARISREDLQVVATWAAEGLALCAQGGVPIQAEHCEKILTLCKKRLSTLGQPPKTPGVNDLSGWRF